MGAIEHINSAGGPNFDATPPSIKEKTGLARLIEKITPSKQRGNVQGAQIGPTTQEQKENQEGFLKFVKKSVGASEEVPLEEKIKPITELTPSEKFKQIKSIYSEQYSKLDQKSTLTQDDYTWIDKTLDRLATSQKNTGIFGQGLQSEVKSFFDEMTVKYTALRDQKDVNAQKGLLLLHDPDNTELLDPANFAKIVEKRDLYTKLSQQYPDSKSIKQRASEYNELVNASEYNELAKLVVPEPKQEIVFTPNVVEKTEKQSKGIRSLFKIASKPQANLSSAQLTTPSKESTRTKASLLEGFRNLTNTLNFLKERDFEVVTEKIPREPQEWEKEFMNTLSSDQEKKIFKEMMSWEETPVRWDIDSKNSTEAMFPKNEERFEYVKVSAKYDIARLNNKTLTYADAKWAERRIGEFKKFDADYGYKDGTIKTIINEYTKIVENYNKAQPKWQFAQPEAWMKPDTLMEHNKSDASLAYFQSLADQVKEMPQFDQGRIGHIKQQLEQTKAFKRGEITELPSVGIETNQESIDSFKEILTKGEEAKNYPKQHITVYIALKKLTDTEWAQRLIQSDEKRKKDFESLLTFFSEKVTPNFEKALKKAEEAKESDDPSKKAGMAQQLKVLGKSKAFHEIMKADKKLGHRYSILKDYYRLHHT